MDKTEHSNLPVVVTDHIEAIIKKMRYRKKVRAEVRQELADHFADALAECKDNKERNAQAQAMIEEFGDAQLLGVLLRRAKKRCRPLWRTMVVRMFQAVGILFVLLVVYIGWFITGKPVITTNYLERLNTIVRPVADDSQNAWPYYRQAAESYVDLESKEFDKSPRPLSTLTPEERDVLLQWIADNQLSLELIRQGNQMPYYWQRYGHGEEVKTDLISIQLVHLADYRDIAYLLCWQASLDASKGNLVAAFENIIEAYSFGQRLRGQHTALIEQLLAIAFEAMSTRNMRILLYEHCKTIDVSLLGSVRKRFEVRIAEGNFVICFEAEKMMLFDTIQRGFAQNSFGITHPYLKALQPIELLRLLDEDTSSMRYWLYLFFGHPDREQTFKTAEQLYTFVSHFKQMTPASVQNENFNNQIDEIIKGNLFMKILTPAFGKVVELSYRGQVDSFATLTILAVLQYEKTHGEYPNSLEALVEAGLLDTLPMDPFSDAPLVYRTTQDGFTLYSVGLNFSDDGGVPGTSRDGKPTLWAETGDAVFWPVLKYE